MRKRCTQAIGAMPVAAVKRRLKVRSAGFDCLIISSTGLATEKCVLSVTG